MAEEERRPNPFIEGLKRAAMVPVNAVQFLPRLGNELLGSPVARQQEFARTAQRDLKQRVTGEPVPYSEGRDWAHFLSLGLVPDNPVADVDPRQLNPEQAQRFQQMTPLQQALLQAKRPQDFADLLTKDDLFAEEVSPKPYTEMGQLNADVQNGFVSPIQAAMEEERRAREALQQGIGDVNPQHYTPESLSEYQRTGDPRVLQRDLSAETARHENAMDLESARQGNRLELEGARAANARERAQATADAKAAAAETKPLDPHKVANRENELRDDFRQVTRDVQKAGVGFRQAQAMFGLKDPSKISSEWRSEIEKTVPSILDTSNRAARDMAQSYIFFKVLDPGGRITDTETGLIRGLNQVLGGFLGAEKAAEIVGSMVRREALTDQLRAEMHIAMGKAFEAQFQSYDDQVRGGLKNALRMRLGDPTNNLPGIPVRPLNTIEDSMSDMRQLFMSQAGIPAKQARFVQADEEAERLLSEIFLKEKGREPESASEWVDYANSMGFRLNVAE